MRQATVLGLLACILAAASMVAVKAKQSGEGFSARPLLVDVLGGPRPDAAFARHPAQGVRVDIGRRGFRVAGPKARVSLQGLGIGTAPWARYEHGVARPTVFGHETVVVTPEKVEQFLTVERRQGPKTWRWRLAAGELQPIVGNDGAVGLWSGHTLASVHVDPVALLDTAGHDVTPSGLRWSLVRDQRGWLLELRVDDAHLPLPYVIDPAITYVAAGGGNNAGGATTLVITKPPGVVENNLLVAQLTVRGGTGIGAITSPGWTSTAPGWATLRQDYTNVNASQTFWKVAGAAEPATYTWSWGATSAKASGGIIALKGVDNAAPVDQFGGSVNGTSTTNILAPSIMTQTANTMLIGLFGSTSSPTTNVTPPASMTERYEAASTSGVSTRNEGATEPFAAVGATGTRTATTDQTGSSIGQLIALKLDTTNPTGSVTAPAASANVRGAAVTVSSDSADGGSGVANAQFQRSPAGGGVWTNIGAADTTSPYSVAWDTTAVVDGLYDLRVVTTDNAANPFTSALITNVRVDNTNPTGAVTAPAASANVRGNAVTVSSNSLDGGSGVANAQFQRSPAGGGVWTNIGAADTTSPYSVAWDTTAVADGLYDLRVVTSDNAGNTFTSALITNVRVDNTNPTGSVTAPAASANVRGAAVTVSSNSADGGSGVANAQFQRSPAGGGVWTNIGAADTTSPYSVAWDTTAVADGLYDLRVITTDNVGNTFTSALITNVRVDNTAPANALSLSSVAPAGGAFLFGTTVYYRGSPAGSFQLTNAVSDAGSGPASSTYPALGGVTTGWSHTGQTISTPVGGPYVSTSAFAWSAGTSSSPTEAVQGADNAGNTVTTTLTFTNDTTAPSGSVTAPAASANVRGAAVTVSSNSADGGSGVANAQFQRSPAGGGVWTNIGAADTTSPYSVAWDTTAVADGLYDLRVITTDNVGNSFTSALVTNVRVDNTNPTGSVTAPAASANVRGAAVTVGSNSADGGSGVASADFQRSPAGAGMWTTIATDNSSPYSVAWDTTAVADGLYDLRVITTDNVGNSFTSALVTNVRVDNTNPTGSVTAPAASANVRGAAVTVGSNSADGGSGVANAQFQRSPAGGGVWTNIGAADTTSPYSVAWDTTAVADGLYDLRVITTDNVGNSFTSALIANVRVDNTNPTGSVTAPGAGANVTGSAVPVSSDSADGGSGVASAQFQRSPAGAGVWTVIATDNSSPYSVAWDTTALADGSYDLRLITTDNAGNTFTSAVRTVTVDNSAPAAPALSFGSLTNASVTGSTVYYRTGVAGGFTVTGTASDPQSGIDHLTFPGLGSGWTGGGADMSSPYNGVYTFNTSATNPTEPNDVTATNNVGITSSPASFTVTPDSLAPVSSILCDGGTCAGGWYTGTVSVSLSATDGGSGLQEIRFTTDGTDPGSINGSVYSAPFDVLVTRTVKFRAYDMVGNEEAVGSRLVQIDSSAPTGPALTLAESPASTSQHISGTTLYYNPQGGNAGTFTVDAATSDPESGIEKVTFPAVTGMTGGGDDAANPYQGSYSWTASTTGSGAQTVTARNNAALTSNADFTVTPDTTAPGSQTAALIGGPYYTNASVGFTTGDGSDSGAGLNTASRLIERAEATLSNGTCTGGFSSFGGSYSSPDTSVVSGNCYRYRFTIADNVGNVSAAVITADAKVDTSAPTATMGDPGTTLRGTIVLTSTTGDPESGVATVTYQHSPTGQNTWTANAAGWDTTGVADGLYDLRAVVTNNAGTTTNSAIVANRRVDNTAPSATMDDPGSPLSDTTTLTSTASDASGSGLDTATFQYSYQGTGPWTTIGTDSSAPFSVDWDTTAGLDGRYNLRVIVTDVAGNSTTSSTVTNRKIQNLPPLVNITAPGNYINAASPSPFTITTTIEAPQFAVDNVEFFRCTDASANCSTGTFASIGIDVTSPYTASWAQASEPEGNRTLKAVLTDVDGGIGEDVFNVTIDRTAPTGSITAPGAGAYVGGTTVAASSDSADTLSGVDQVVFQRSPAGQSTWTAIATDTTPPYSVNWDTTSLSDGAFDLRAVTTDLAGNSFNGPLRTVNIDNTGPTATQDDPGANLRATATLSGSASDAAGIAQVVFQRSPAGQASWAPIATDTTFPYSTSFDTTGVADGLYDFRIVATDSVGNQTSSAPVVNRRVDNTAPGATMTSPGANIRTTVSLGATTSDGGSGMASVRYERSPAGQSSWTAIGTSNTSPYSLSFDTTAVGDGLYDVRAVATDAAGNSTTSAAVTDTRVDNTPPGATMNDPGANFGGTVGLTSTTSDGGSGIDTVTYQYSQAGQSSWTTTPPSWNTTLVGDGYYDLRAIATDNAGNSTTSALVVDRRVDNGVPTISISQPGTYVNASDADPFTVTASSPDTDLANVQFFACDNASANCSTGNWVPLGTDTSAPYNAPWALPGLDGNRALRAIATDLASNAGQAVHNVLVDRAAPSGGSVSYLDGYDTTGSLTITTSNGTDPGSGVDAASGVIQRDAVTLTGGACDTFAGSWTGVTSPDPVASGNCFRYRYRISDLAGNTATYTSGNVAKVDTSAPSTPTLSFSSLTNAVTSGQTVFFRAGVAGGFTVDASSTDTQSGIASYAFPALGSGWSASPSGASDAFSFSSSAADPAEPNNVTVQNNAGLISNPGSFTVTADGAAPVSSIACDTGACAGWYTSTVSVGLSANDGGSGLQEIRYTTDGSNPSPINGVVYVAPFSVSATTTVKFRAYDRLGNEEAVGSQLIEVDTSAPSAPALSYGSFQNAVLAGGVVWYRPSAASGQFAVTASSSDAESGIAGYTFPAAAAGWSRAVSGATATYSHSGSPANPAEPNDVTAQNNAGLTSAPTSFTVDPDGTAPASSIACDSVACSGGWYTSAVSVELSASDGGSGLAEIRYTTDGSDPTPSNGTVYSGAFGLATTTTVRYRAYDLVGNEETVGQQLIRVDSSAPAAPSLTLSESPASANQHVSGTTLFYNPQGGNAGSFTVDAATSDPGSGIDRVSFATLTGMTGGGDAFASPYQAIYDWNANSSASGSQNVVAHDNAGLTSSATFTVTPDTTAPSGQTIDRDGGPYYTTVSVPLTIANGTDSGSGLDTSSGVVERQSATLTTDSCVSWSGFSPVTLVGAADTSVLSGECYRYRYVISDNVGNQSSPSSVSGLAKVDTSAPSAPSLSFSALTNAVTSGQTVYFRAGVAGAFTVTAFSSDAQSGIDFYAFPALGSGWSGTPSGDRTDYSFSSSAADPAEPNDVTAQNHAGLDSSPASFTVTADGTAPVSSIACDGAACTGGWYTSAVSVSLSASDVGSGLQEIRYTTDGSDPGPGNGSVYSAPFSLGATTTVRYRAYDRVGNEETVGSQLVRIDTSAPAVPTLTLSERPASPNQHVSGTTLYYNPQGGNSGTFAVDADVAGSDGSGIDRVNFPSLGGMTGGGDDTTSPYQASYDWSSGSGASGAQTVTVHTNAGLTSFANFTVTPDSAAPTGQSAAVTDGYYTSLSVPVTLQNGSDALSGVDPATAALERETATLANGSCVGWSGSWNAVSLTGGADTTVQSNRCYHYRYSISDNVGNQSGPSATSADAMVDATTPVTSDDAPAGWGNAAVTVTLSVTETGSGVASTQHRVDGGSFQSGTSISIPAPADHSNDGAHSIEYRSTDLAGNVESLRSATVRIDTTLPTTTDDAPAGWRGSAVTVTLTPADALSGIASTQYRIDGGSLQGGTVISIPAPADHSNDGVHPIEYRSTDNAGNAEPLQTATVRIDTQLPSGALTAPADGEHVNGSVAISASAADLPSGVASVEFLVRPNGSGSFTTISTDTTAPYDAIWDSTGSPEGNAELEVVVVDNAGLTVTSAIRTILVDNPPAPTLDDPGANLAGSVTLNAASQADTAQIVFERSPAGAGAWTQIATDTSAPFSADFDTTSVGDGQYDLRAVATDLGGSDGTSALRTARLDNTAPTVSLSDPANGALVAGSSVHVAAVSSDLGSGVSSVRFEQRPAGGGAFTAIDTDTTDPYETAWDATGLSGSYELRAVATDAAGNPTTAATVTVTIDTTAVIVTLDDPGTLLHGVVNLSATAPSATVASVSFERRAAGGSWTRIVRDTTRPWSAAFDTKSVADGVYDLRAQALGSGGQVLATQSRKGISIDNTAPTMLSSTPADGSVVPPVTSVALIASEPVSSVDAALLDGFAATAQISGSNITFSTSQLGAGTHALTGALVDAAGNRGPFAVHFKVTVKAHAALVLRVGKPKTRTESRGFKRVFVVSISLSGPARVQATLLSPTGRRLSTLRMRLSAGRHSLRFRLPTASLPPGRYTILVVATGSDRSKVVKRVHATIAAKATVNEPAEETAISREVVIPAAPASGSGGGTVSASPDSQTPLARTSKPDSKKQAPRVKNATLETASGYVSGSKPGHTVALVLILFLLGGALAFLIKLEMGRMLAPRR